VCILTQLECKVAPDEIKKLRWQDPSLDVLIKRGQEHETAHVEFLSRKGVRVVNLNGQLSERVVEVW
jgi:hypothetical protein